MIFYVLSIKHNNKNCFACWLEDLLLISGGDSTPSKKVTTRYQQQIFQPTRKAIFIIMFNTQYVKYHLWILSL